MRDGVGGHIRALRVFMAPFKPHLQGVLCNARINNRASGLKGLIRLQGVGTERRVHSGTIAGE